MRPVPKHGTVALGRLLLTRGWRMRRGSLRSADPYHVLNYVRSCSLANFDGGWNIQIRTPIGQQVVQLRIVDREGAPLAGTATMGAETVNFIDPSVEGDHIRWTQHVTKPMALTIKFDLRREGDVLSGTAKAGIFSASAVTGRLHS